jgi:mannosyltransferase OCH1-like enzyme
MIPKILHFIWLGSKKRPDKIIQTWIDYHPGWTVKIWDDTSIKTLKIKHLKLFALFPSKRYNQKSDLLRLEILYAFGGVYVDCDIICVNPVPLSILKTNFTITVEKQKLLSNAFMGAAKHSPLLLDIMRYMEENWVRSTAVWRSTGPGCITNYLTSRGIVCISYNHRRNYQYISTYLKVHVLPYHSINFSKDAASELLRTDFDAKKSNCSKDLSFGGCVHRGDLIGVHLWFGGKEKNYEQEINVPVILKNITAYLHFVHQHK